MYSQIVSMLEAGTCPSKVVNTLRIKYAKDSQKVLEVPGASVVRNLLRGLRFTNPVISRKIKELQISDHVGSSEFEDSPSLALDMNLADLRHYVDLHDFERYINSRDSSIPPLGLTPGGDEGQHATLGHDMITFKEFGDDKCITFFNERIMVATLVECVRSCWDKVYHVGNPERGHWKHRKHGVVFSCDDTYKISYEGGWVLTATVVVCTYLYHERSKGLWGVQHKAKVVMFQYSKASTNETLCDYLMGAISHVVQTLAHMEAGHCSGLGELLPREWDTVYIATGCGDNAAQVAHMFNAQLTSTQDHLIKMTRPTDEDFSTLFLTCWVHLVFALGKRKYEGTTVEERLHAQVFMSDVVRFIYYSKTGEERDSLYELVAMACEITGNAANGEWFAGEYQTTPHSCWHYSASLLPGAIGNQNPIESFWKAFKHQLMDTCRVGHKVLLHDVFPSALTQLWPLWMGAPTRQCFHLGNKELEQARQRLCGTEEPVVQNPYRPEYFYVNSGVLPASSHIVPPNYTLYHQITHCTPKLHLVPPNYTLCPQITHCTSRITHCTPRLHIVPPDYTFCPTCFSST